MIREAFNMDDLTYATLHEECLLAIPYQINQGYKEPKLFTGRCCRYLWLIFIHDYTYELPKGSPVKKDPLVRQKRIRILLEDSLSEATAIREIEAAGLVEVQKGAEDPETLLRVWVKDR